MWTFLRTINKHLIIAIPLMLAAGFLAGSVADPRTLSGLKPLILPFTFLMVYPMMVTLNVHHLATGFNPRLQLTTQLLNFAVIPFFAYFLGLIFFPDQPYLALGLLLTALLPTSGMTISWTGFAKGHVGAAINMTVIGLTLGSLLTPFYLRVLMGATVAIDLAGVIRQIGVIVFMPMLFGQITRYVLLRRHGAAVFKQRIGPLFPPLSTIGVLGIVFVAMALKARSILDSPAMLAAILVPLLLLYAGNFIVSTITARLLFRREEGIALVYGSVMRNLSIALAIAITSFGEAGAQAALIIALAYIIQVQSAAWYVRLTNRIFGAASAAAEPSRSTA